MDSGNKFKYLDIALISVFVIVLIFLLVYKLFYSNNYVVSINGSNYTSLDISNYVCNYENFNNKNCSNYNKTDINKFVEFEISSLYLKSKNNYPNTAYLNSIKRSTKYANLKMTSHLYDYILNLSVNYKMDLIFQTVEKNYNGFIFMDILPSKSTKSLSYNFDSIYNHVKTLSGYNNIIAYLSSLNSNTFNLIKYTNLNSQNIKYNNNINPIFYNNISSQIFSLSANKLSSVNVHPYVFCARGCTNNKESFNIYYFIYNDSIFGKYSNYTSYMNTLEKKYNIIYY